MPCPVVAFSIALNWLRIVSMSKQCEAPTNYPRSILSRRNANPTPSLRCLPMASTLPVQRKRRVRCASPFYEQLSGAQRACLILALFPSGRQGHASAGARTPVVLRMESDVSMQRITSLLGSLVLAVDSVTDAGILPSTTFHRVQGLVGPSLAQCAEARAFGGGKMMLSPLPSHSTNPSK
jgi:hypothetical protein